MFTLLDHRTYEELVAPFCWSPEPVGFEVLPVPQQQKSCDEAIQDIIVQLCLTEVLAGISGTSHPYVPIIDRQTTYDNLLCFFEYVHQIGERDDFVLLNVCLPKEHTLKYYRSAVKNNLVHPLLVKSWENRLLLSKYISTDCDSIEMICKPESKAKIQISAHDRVSRYIRKFSCPVLLNIPLILKEDEFENHDIFRAFDRSGYQIFLSVYREGNGGFVSQSMGLYNRPLSAGPL